MSSAPQPAPEPAFAPDAAGTGDLPPLEVVPAAGPTAQSPPREPLRADSPGPRGRFWKRTLDVSVAALGLVLLAPLIAFLALWVRLDSPGPAFFRQVRIGRDGRPFRMVKLRTMIDGADAMRPALRLREGIGDGLFKLGADPRITKLGARLRAHSLDELPQLWNVLRGDMSLVGPRPLPLDEAFIVGDRFPDRVRVRPGITGPWQIEGRSELPFEEMISLDHAYVANWTLREDLRLLLATAGAVLSRRGAY